MLKCCDETAGSIGLRSGSKRVREIPKAEVETRSESFAQIVMFSHPSQKKAKVNSL